MSLSRFLRALEASGRVKVGPYEELSPKDLHESQAVLEDLDRTARLELAGEPPKLSVFVALWGAKTLYRSAQFLIYRGIDAEEVDRVLREPCPEMPSATAIYSVDLTLRYLPDLIDLARGIARRDPLVRGLLALAEDWPLSSVGVETSARGSPRARDRVDLAPILEHPTLRRLYLDRVIHRGARSAADRPEVREAIRTDLGAFPELCPASFGEEASR